MHQHCILIIFEEIWTFFIPPFSIQIVFCLILAHASFHINSSIISWGTVVERARCITADIASVSKMIIYPTTLHKISENTGFQWPVFSRIRTESSTILSLYGRIRVSENPYSCIFCTVQQKKFSFSIIFTSFIVLDFTSMGSIPQSVINSLFRVPCGFTFGFVRF